MYIKIQTSPLSSGNTGSCTQLVRYLNKENQQALEQGLIEEISYFFSEEKEMVFSNEVIESIDNNKKGLGKNEAKFYSLVISPNEKELEHIRCSKEKLIEYTRTTMQAYAENFNKGLNSQDLVWYAKIEKERKYTGLDIIPEDKKQGDIKTGDNTHIHIIVSRKTVDNAKRISPLANQRGTEITTGKGQKVVAGFDRDKFVQKCEDMFDKQFKYERQINESYKYFKEKQVEKIMMPQEQKESYNFSIMQEQTLKIQKQIQADKNLENIKGIELG